MPKVTIIRYVDPHDLNSYPMLGLGYLKSYVDHHMPGGVEFKYLENVAGLLAVRKWDSDLYAFTALSQDYEDIIRMAKYVRIQTDAPIILGGSHVSYLPSSLDPVFCAGVPGDGEPVFLELCRLLDQGKHLTSVELSCVPGLLYWDNYPATKPSLRVISDSCFKNTNGNRNARGLRFSPASEGVADLDVLPFPDRKFGGEGLLPHLLSSRGCPFTCSFCTSSEYWKKFRGFSADYIKAEIVEIAEKFPDCDFLPFWDDLFVANRKRFSLVVDMLCRTRLNQIFTFSCGVRVDLVDRELCELLKRGNFRAVFFGLESGSNRILKWLKGGKVDVPRMQQALDLFKDYGFTVAAPFIVGIPTEEEEDLRRTYEFVVRNMSEGKLHEAQSHVMCPMPGTQIWRNALEQKIVTEDVDFEWSRMRYYSGWRNYVSDNRTRGTFADWVKARDENRSLYINSAYSQDRLYEVMENYETQIDKMGLECSKY